MSKEKVKELDKRVQNNKDRNKQEKNLLLIVKWKGGPIWLTLKTGKWKEEALSSTSQQRLWKQKKN